MSTMNTDGMQVAEESKGNGLGIAGFVVSLVGFLGGCIGGVVLCPIGAVMSGIAMRRQPRGFAIAGLVIGIVGSIWLIVGLLVVGVGGVGLFAAMREYGGAIKVQVYANQFYDANGRLPTDLAELTAAYPESPTTDRKGAPLGYRVDSPTSFTVIMPGDDGVLGTQDDSEMPGDVK